jgi:hypothetical protein
MKKENGNNTEIFVRRPLRGLSAGTRRLHRIAEALQCSGSFSVVCGERRETELECVVS